MVSTCRSNFGTKRRVPLSSWNAEVDLGVDMLFLAFNEASIVLRYLFRKVVNFVPIFMTVDSLPAYSLLVIK